MTDDRHRFSTGARTAVLPVADGGDAPAPKKRRDKVKIAFLTILALLVVVLLVVGVFAWNICSSFDRATKIEDAFPGGDRPAAVEGAQTILLLGSDSRGSEEGEDLSGRSDSMMVVHIPADHETISIMSIMRDNWVEIPGHGEGKINGALSLGGLPLVVQTVEGIIDTRVDHVAIIDFQGFAGMADALGGVTVDNPREFTAVSGEHFDEGEITLRGADALAFVRERKAFATGDYARAANQQLFLQGLLSETLSAETLLNPFRVSELVSETSPFLSVDAGVDPWYLLSTIWQARDIRSADVHFFTSPTLGTGWRGGQSVVLPDWEEMDAVRQAIKDGTLSEYEPPKL
jgi:LCP family protein required for cell wall assembly